MEFRALIDPSLQVSFVSETTAQALRLYRILSIRSKTDSPFCLTFSATILPKLSAPLSPAPVRVTDLDHVKGLELADPDYALASQVNCILGDDLYPAIILEGLWKGKPDMPVAQNTRFGWILTRPTSDNNISSFLTLCCFTTGVTISEQLRKF